MKYRVKPGVVITQAGLVIKPGKEIELTDEQYADLHDLVEGQAPVPAVPLTEEEQAEMRARREQQVQQQRQHRAAQQPAVSPETAAAEAQVEAEMQDAAEASATKG